jgi:hypothetical protein
MIEPGKVRWTGWALCSPPARVHSQDMGTHLLSNRDGTDCMFNRYLSHIRVDRTGIQVKNGGMNRQWRNFWVHVPARYHLIHGQVTKPEMRRFQPELHRI